MRSVTARGRDTSPVSMSAGIGLALGNFSSSVGRSSGSSRHDNSTRRSPPRLVTERTRPRHRPLDGRGPGPGEERSGVIPSEQGRGQIEHIPVHQAGAVEGVGHAWLRPRPGPGAIPRRPSSSSTSPRSPPSSRAGPHGGPGGRPARAPPGAAARRGHGSTGPRAAAARSGPGRRPGPCPPRPGRRRTGPAAGGRPAGRLGAGDPLAGPVGRGRPPSSVAASLRTTQGRPVAPVLQVGGQLLGDRLRPHPHLDLDAGRPQGGDAPSRRPGGRGPRRPPPPGGCPEAMMASVQGGVRPWWAHGSRVTYSVPDRGPRARRRARAATSAWGPPGGAVAPANHVAGAARRRPAPPPPPPTGWAPCGPGPARPPRRRGPSTRRRRSGRSGSGTGAQDGAPATASTAAAQDVGRPPPAGGPGRTPPSRPRTRWPPSGPPRPRCARRCPPSTSTSRVRPARSAACADLAHLGHDVGDEGLPAETGEDGHAQDQVDLVEDRARAPRTGCRDWRPAPPGGRGRASGRSARRSRPPRRGRCSRRRRRRGTASR